MEPNIAVSKETLNTLLNLNTIILAAIDARKELVSDALLSEDEMANLTSAQYALRSVKQLIYEYITTGDPFIAGKGFAERMARFYAIFG